MLICGFTFNGDGEELLQSEEAVATRADSGVLLLYESVIIISVVVMAFLYTWKL